MVKITYIDHEGTARTVEVREGWTVKDGAIENAIPGIDGDCGGACACATCHVYVAPEWIAKLPPMEEMEESMLDFAVGVQANSRLACQLRVTPELDGLIVTTPKSQH